MEVCMLECSLEVSYGKWKIFYYYGDIPAQ